MNILKTERLVLRPFNTSDTPFILQLLNSPGWLQFIGDRGIKDLNDAQNYLTNGPIASYKQHGFGLYLVELKNDKTPIGMCGILKRDFLDDADIGFALLPEYEKKGYAFEAAKATLVHAIRNLGFNNLAAITSIGNSKSERLLEKLGFQFQRFIEFPDKNEELKLFIKQFN